MRHLLLLLAVFFPFAIGMQAASMPGSAHPATLEVAGKSGGFFGPRTYVSPASADEQLDELSNKMINNAKASLGLFLAQLLLNIFAVLLLLGASTTAGLGGVLLLAGLSFICGIASLVFLIIGLTNKRDLDNALMARDNPEAYGIYRAKTSSARTMLAVTGVLTGIYIFINLVALAAG